MAGVMAFAHRAGDQARGAMALRIPVRCVLSQAGRRSGKAQSKCGGCRSNGPQHEVRRAHAQCHGSRRHDFDVMANIVAGVMVVPVFVLLAVL